MPQIPEKLIGRRFGRWRGCASCGNRARRLTLRRAATALLFCSLFPVPCSLFPLPSASADLLWDNGPACMVNCGTTAGRPSYQTPGWSPMQSADDLLPDAPWRPRRLTLVGGWNIDPLPVPAADFRLFLYPDDGGRPAGSETTDPRPLAIWTLDVPRAATGQTWLVDYAGYRLCAYDMALVDAPVLAAGTRYWLVVQAQDPWSPSWAGGYWIWLSSGPTARGLPMQYGRNNGPNYWIEAYYDVSFRLYGEVLPEPAAGLFLLFWLLAFCPCRICNRRLRARVGASRTGTFAYPRTHPHKELEGPR